MTRQTKAEAALLATTLIWGGTFPVVKLGMDYISPLLLVAVRFLIASSLVLVLFRRRLFPMSRAVVARGAMLGIVLFMGFVFQNIGLTITTASKSAFITGMMVVFVPILQFAIERRAPKLGNLIGVLVVTVGLWLLTSPDGSTFNVGDALTIVCAVLFAFYIVELDEVSKEMSTERLTFLQMTSCAVLALAGAAVFESPRFAVTPVSLAALAYLTLLATVLTTYVQTRFQKDTTPTRAVVIFSIEPVIASAIAYVLLGETLAPLGMVGGGLIIVGVLVSELSDLIPGLDRSLDPSKS